MRIKLTIEYDGTEYCGWQIQPNGITIQQRINEAVKAVTGEDVCVTGSGRTDAGVHALGQVAHFDTSSRIPAERFAPALNSALPKDIRVIKSELVDDDFNARFCAKSKTYRYSMYLSDTVRPMLDRYSAQVNASVDVTSMKQVAETFVGEHDFRAFMATGSEVKDTVRTIFLADISCEGEQVVFTVSGNGFLYNMVRIMAGTLVGVGTGKLSVTDVVLALESGERTRAGKTMPPRGLSLIKVEY